MGIAIKKTTKKLELNKTTAELQALCENAGIRLLPIDAKYFDTIQLLPMIHGDPFDRLIIATAKEESLTIVTDDEKIRLYPDVETVWQGRDSSLATKWLQKSRDIVESAESPESVDEMRIHSAVYHEMLRKR